MSIGAWSQVKCISYNIRETVTIGYVVICCLNFQKNFFNVSRVKKIVFGNLSDGIKMYEKLHFNGYGLKAVAVPNYRRPYT